MMPDQVDELLEAATGAYREVDPHGRLRPAPSWWDLAPRDREQLHHRQLTARAMERAIDEQGRTSTVRAVLARLP